MKNEGTIQRRYNIWISKDLRPNKDCYIDINFGNEKVERYFYVKNNDVIIKKMVNLLFRFQ